MNRAAALIARLLEDELDAKDWLMDVSDLEAALLNHGFRNITDEAGPDRRPKYALSSKDPPFRVYVTVDADSVLVKATTLNHPQGETRSMPEPSAVAFIDAVIENLRDDHSPFIALTHAALAAASTPRS